MAKRTMTAALVALLVAVSAGNLMAAGRGTGGTTRGMGRPATPPNPSTVRPADAQRRDGTFLTTGTTAGGSTARPTNGSGKGLRDGSGMTGTVTAVQ